MDVVVERNAARHLFKTLVRAAHSRAAHSRAGHSRAGHSRAGHSRAARILGANGWVNALNWGALFWVIKRLDAEERFSRGCFCCRGKLHSYRRIYLFCFGLGGFIPWNWALKASCCNECVLVLLRLAFS